MYILSVIINVFRVLDEKTRVKYVWLQIFFLLSSLIQIVGVASIAPFIGVLSNPSVIHTSPIFSRVYSYFQFQSDTQFIVAFAIVSLIMIVISNLIAGVTIWLTFRFAILVGSNLQNKLLNNLLNREYIYHKISNESYATALVNQEAPRFVYMVLQPFLTLTSQFFIAALILLGLLILDPIIAIIAGSIISGAYLLTYIYLRKSLVRHGRIVTERNNGVQATLSEAFTGIKDIKISHNENIYLTRFAGYNTRGLSSNAFIALAGDLPKLVIESISFGAILILAIFLLKSDSSTSEVMSMLSLYAIAGYKLLPAMQQIYKSVSSISANGAVVLKLAGELEKSMTLKPNDISKLKYSADSISTDGVSFMYPNSKINALNEISVSFRKGTINTIVGPSGSGKSTLADILLGLLIPSTGHLLVNNRIIDKDEILRYQNSIGFVPQHIFLTNDTIAANVAFGFGKDNIDRDRVINALKLANALEFVEKLPEGIDTSIGQDGKLLSGGQRQRIGIARALYKQTSILILDEPTSALDIHSEHDFMKCLSELKDKILVILISHRPAAIKMSDNIAIVSNGELSACGSYTTLVTKNDEFKTLMQKATAETEKETAALSNGI